MLIGGELLCAGATWRAALPRCPCLASRNRRGWRSARPSP